jgi:hypothetical protein
VEFALLLPLFAVLCGCIVAVTAACLQVLALADTARNAARLAAVSSDPAAAASAFVADGSPGTVVRTVTDGTTVRVQLRRTVRVAVPLVGRVSVPLPLSAGAVMLMEPPMEPVP